jgi:hypothetical protein
LRVGGVGIVPAEITLVDGLGVVAEGAVVAAQVPLACKTSWRCKPLGDNGRREAAIHEPQRLVMQVLIGIALLGEIIEQARVAPDRPVVLSEHHVRLPGKAVARLVEVFGPGVGVAHLCAPDRVDVGQVVSGGFGQVEGMQVGIEHVHLGRCFCVGGELEHNLGVPCASP